MSAMLMVTKSCDVVNTKILLRFMMSSLKRIFPPQIIESVVLCFETEHSRLSHIRLEAQSVLRRTVSRP
jgi:hypothetical protein